MAADDVVPNVIFFGNFRDLLGHKSGVNSGEREGGVDPDCIFWHWHGRFSGRRFGDRNIDASIAGIPAAGEDDMVKQVSRRMQGKPFLFSFCLGIIPGKGGGNEQDPQETDKKGVLSYFHKK
ncbi:MAG: hypothetical protein FD168_2406 [Desulfobulbaceae bacterium]|nr:MAG: hypothetical protein FD168_2406 [Desulfobulbaceae bacterium]